jgi:hypothetical protein
MDNVVLDIPVVLSEVTMTDAYDGLFTERRALIWTLTFTMKAWFFGPVKESKIIKIAKVNLYPTMNKFANTIFDRVTLTPGLTETGQPTSYSTLSIVQCLASAAINNAGEVEEINVDQSGIGYSGASITVGPAPLGGRTATAKPVITHGVLDKIVVTDKGSGYTSIPYVTVSTPDLASIPYIEIDENDDFGFVVTIEEREK